MEQKIQDSGEWEKKLSRDFEDLGILEGEDLRVYLEVLKSQQDLTGNEIVEKFAHLKRTHIYAILNRLQKDGWVELTNPGTRPALYRAMNPLSKIEGTIINQQQKINQLEELQNYIRDEVVPNLSSEQRYGGRVSNTFIIPTISDLYHQVNDHLKNAKIRVMLHASSELFLQLKETLLKAINRIFDTCKEKNIHLRDEDRRDRFALIITGKIEDLESNIELPERLRIILDPNVSQTDIIIIDNFVFINNINTGFGLSLRINDQNVASTYAILLSHIFLEKQIELYGNRDLGILGIHMSKENILKEIIQQLFEKGWKTLPDHTNSTEHFDELGLVAPGSERAFFRLSGIRYYPFAQEESKDQQIHTLFKDTVNRGLAYIQRLRRQMKIHGKKEETKKIHGHDCYIYWIKYEFKEEWVPLIGNISKMDSIPDKGEGFVIATFNFNDKAAMSIWAINPVNVLIILEILLKQF